MVTARRRDDPGHLCPRALQVVHVDNAAAYFEGTSWSVVFVLHPHFTPGPLGKKRPSILRGWWHAMMDEVSCSL